MAQKKINTSGIVYSTDSNFSFDSEPDEKISLTPAEQQLYVSLDKKHRGGKVVTVIAGYRGTDIEDTGKELKKYCGTGGSVKDGIIIVQGDNREKIIVWLSKKGYKHVKKT